MRSSKIRFESGKVTALKHVFKDAILAFLRACYPVFIYLLITWAVEFLLGLMFRETMIELVIAQGIGALATLPYLLPVYRKDFLIHSANLGVRPIERLGKKDEWFRFLYAALTIALMSVAVNNLIGFSTLEAYSEAYQRLRDNLFAGSVALQLLFYGIAIPYAEELLYRGIIFGRMKVAFGAKRAIVISAVVFGLMHFNLVQFVYATIVGLALAYFTDKYASVIPALLGHAAANIIAVIRAAGGLPISDNPLAHLILTIVCIAAAVSLFGVQFKVKKLR